MSATSGICRDIAGRGWEGAPKLGEAGSPTVELSQSFNVMPPRPFRGRRDQCRQHSTIRANSCSRPVSLRRPTSAISLPARPKEETIVFPRRSPAWDLTFVPYGKERVKERDGRL